MKMIGMNYVVIFVMLLLNQSYGVHGSFVLFSQIEKNTLGDTALLNLRKSADSRNKRQPNKCFLRNAPDRYFLKVTALFILSHCITNPFQKIELFSY